MNGQMKNCNTYENRKVVEEYLKEFSPYENRASIAIDLVELTRYAKKNGREIKELSEEEILMFKKA